MNMKQAGIFIAALGVQLASLLTMAQAAQTGDSVTYDFKGHVVISTPCTVNNDRQIDITFGNVGVKKVNGTNFIQTIPYSVDCQGAADNSPIILTVNGTATTFDNAAMTTSADGLGIQIQANGQPMPLNQALKTTLGELPNLVLQAVPVKDPSKELAAQTFSATATLMAEYQ